MADTIRELLVRLGVDAQDKNLKRFDKSLGQVKKRMAVVAAGFVAGGALITKSVLDFAKAGDTAAKEAKRIRITAEEYQELGFAMQRAGGSSAYVTKALKRQAKLTNDLSRGLSTAKDAFADMGIEQAEVAGLSQVQLFEKMAEGIAGIEDPIKQVAIAQEAWGRAGVNLLPLINDQENSIADLREEARRLGFVIDNETAKAAEEFQDRLLDVKMILTGLRNVIGEALLPTFTRLLTRFKEWFLVNKDLIGQRLEDFADRIAEGFEHFLGVAKKVDDFVRNNLGGWESLLKKVAIAAALLTAVWVAAPMVTMVASLVTMVATGSTLSLILAGILAIVLAIAAGFSAGYLAAQDIITFLKGGESVTGKLLDKVLEIRDAFDATKTAVMRTVPGLEKVKRIIDGIVTAVKVMAPIFNFLGRPQSFAAGKEVGKGLAPSFQRGAERQEARKGRQWMQQRAA